MLAVSLCCAGGALAHASAPGAKCSLRFAAGDRVATFTVWKIPPTGAAGATVFTWRVPKTAQSWKWSFPVTCAKQHRRTSALRIVRLIRAGRP
jgi:hypothetical protein